MKDEKTYQDWVRTKRTVEVGANFASDVMFKIRDFERTRPSSAPTWLRLFEWIDASRWAKAAVLGVAAVFGAGRIFFGLVMLLSL